MNLGAINADYSKASVTFQKLKTGQQETITVKGSPVVWTLSIPDQGADATTAREFVRWLLIQKSDVLNKNGFSPILPSLFFGAAGQAAPFKGVVKWEGEMQTF